MRAKWFVLPALLLVAVALALGPTREASTQAKAPDTIRIGATLAVTGPFSPEWGPPMLKFMTEWTKVVNEEGGIFLKEFNAKVPIELVIYDDESKPPKSVELYEKLNAADKVHVFLGPSTSPITMAASTVAEKLSIPMMACEANDTALFTRDLKWFAGVLELGYPWSETYFDMIGALNKRGATKYSSVTIISSDRPHTLDVGRGADDFARRAGLKVVFHEKVPFGTTDYSALIAKIKPLDPDIVFLSLWPPEMIAFVKQAEELKLKPRDLYSRFLGAGFITGVSPRLAEGVTGATYNAKKWFAGTRAEKVAKRLGVDPYDVAWLAIKYNCMEALLTALQDAGTLDRAKVMATIRAYNKAKPIKAVYGPLFFSWNVQVGDKQANGFGTQKPIVMQVQGGKLQVIWPEAAADAKYKATPRPY
ncbi:MAG: amino acid ABC transporter substrate-binding protein [Candidatus Rokubacteria bacterium]|nr:amino acid ABC transporter substrate-binding protein [Candidatus Rokubacteria bacterium]MBI2555062.1 amino acid ABC transporter substrate-binding protein [Candidatus Rokubacteria bacterium]